QIRAYAELVVLRSDGMGGVEVPLGSDRESLGAIGELASVCRHAERDRAELRLVAEKEAPTHRFIVVEILIGVERPAPVRNREVIADLGGAEVGFSVELDARLMLREEKFTDDEGAAHADDDG